MIGNQAYLFIVFALTGVIIGILFDIFRILRRTFKTSNFITYIEDIMFWTLSGILMLYNIWYFNNGEIRIFIFLGIILGTLIYMLTLSNFVLKFFTLILKTMIRVIKIPFKPMIFIFQKISAIFMKKIHKFSNFLQNKKGNLEKNGE